MSISPRSALISRTHVPHHQSSAASCGADPHARRTRAHVVAALLAIGLAGACGGSGASSTVSAADADKSIRDLIAVYQPGDPNKTSDFEDSAFRARVQALERLRTAGPEVGRAALATFAAGAQTVTDIQQALLDVAASNCPVETAPTLERLITTYDGKVGEGLATRAVEILARTSPQRAIELFEPLIRDPGAHQTRPSQESLIEGWTEAASRLNAKDARVLCDVVVDLRQPPDARYAAVRGIAKFGGERAQKALGSVLIEGASDGNLRRKAAQTLLVIMPRKPFCELITEVSEHESDDIFLNFLADLLDKNCAGQ